MAMTLTSEGPLFLQFIFCLNSNSVCFRFSFIFRFYGILIYYNAFCGALASPETGLFVFSFAFSLFCTAGISV